MWLFSLVVSGVLGAVATLLIVLGGHLQRSAGRGPSEP